VGHGSPGFEATGFLQVVKPEHEDRLRANVAMQRQIGIDTRVVTAEDLREIEPLMRTDDITVAAFEPGSGFADPNGTLYGFASAAVAGGAQVCTDTTATAILRDEEGVCGVETSAGRISTRSVVFAGGAWTDRLLTPLGLDLGLTPRRIQVAIFRWPPQVDPRRRHRVVIDATQQSWFRVEGFNGTLIGGERTVTPTDPDTYREGVEDDFVPQARAMLAARMPAFATATMRGGWAGMIMQSQDSHPIIDHVPSVPGLYLMTGDSGSSFKTAPAIGICLAEWITEGTPQLMDLTPFRSTRFAEGKPWVDETAYRADQLLTISR